MLAHTEMILRFALIEDLSQIIDLCKAHALYEQSHYQHQNKAKQLSECLFGSSPALHCLVLAREQTLVGYATFMKQFSTWDANWYLYLDCLYLKEEARGIGIGRQMMDKIREYAQSEKCTMIQWQTPSFNEKAIHFYHKIGALSKSKERFFLEV